MVLPDISLLQAAIVLAEELHFGQAADRLNMSQPTLSKQIFRLERSIGLRLFEHRHQAAELTPAGQVFIAEAREVVFHAERAIISARTVVEGSTEILNFGKSSYTDPFLVSLLTSIALPLFPAMKIKLWSNYSNVLAQQVVAGTLDVALVTGVPSKNKLSTLELANDPYYVAMPTGDELATYNEVRLNQMERRLWVLFGPHTNAPLHKSLPSRRRKRYIPLTSFTSPRLTRLLL